MNLPKVKAIQFAYPSSPNAKRFGFGEVGCYTVAIFEGEKIPKTLQAFSSIAEAETFAGTVALPFLKNSLRGPTADRREVVGEPTVVAK